MVDTVSEIFRHILTLLFGVFISASFLNIHKTRKNLVPLSVFCAADLLVQGSLFYISTEDVPLIEAFYPLIVHFPLILFFDIVFKKKLSFSIFAVTTAYLCCQVCNVMSAVSEAFHASTWVVNVTYSVTLVITFGLVIRFVSHSIFTLLSRPGQPLVLFWFIPVFYYIFDYTTTVYTELLYTGNRFTAEFMPFLLCLCYFAFCIVYFNQYGEKQKIEARNELLRVRQEQSEKKIEAMRRNEKALSLLRHDMRHFLTNISSYIENGETKKACEYIRSIIETADKTVNKRYCTNDMINMLLSSYEEMMTENNICFRYTIQIPSQLPFSDMDITSILANALENAIHAVLPLDREHRIIELSITEKSDKILFSLANTYFVKPKLVDGLPVSKDKGHGFGTQSIVYTTEKLNGNCQFSVVDERFILQIVL